MTDYEISNGIVCGKIISYSRAGLFWKTYEGALLCNGLKPEYRNGTNISVANTIKFSLDENDIIKNASLTQQIEKHLLLGSDVCLKYRKPLIKYPWQGATNLFVKELVESLKFED